MARNLSNKQIRAMVFTLVARDLQENRGGDIVPNMLHAHSGTSQDEDEVTRVIDRLIEELQRRAEKASADMVEDVSYKLSYPSYDDAWYRL